MSPGLDALLKLLSAVLPHLPVENFIFRGQKVEKVELADKDQPLVDKPQPLIDKPQVSMPALASMPTAKGTACLPCSNWHFHRISGSLEEAVRMMRGDGLTSEVVSRVINAEQELSNMESQDLTSEKLAALSDKDREIGEEAAGVCREVRHNIDQFYQDKELRTLMSAATKATNAAVTIRLKQLGLPMYGIMEAGLAGRKTTRSMRGYGIGKSNFNFKEGV